MTAHKLKNYDSKLSCTLRNEYTYQNSLLLTGTPLQNNTGKLSVCYSAGISLDMHLLNSDPVIFYALLA
jgi:hypothetical protein